MSKEYKEEKNSEISEKVADLLTVLPAFCRQYDISISTYNKPLTRFAYLQRIQFFLQWLLDYNAYFSKKYDTIQSLTIQDLEQLTKADFEEFFYHLQNYGALSKDEIANRKQLGKVILKSKSTTINNYLSALRSLFNYFLDSGYINEAPVLRVHQAKVDKNVVVALDGDQADRIINVIDNGSEDMTSRQAVWLGKNGVRDKAIYELLLTTGIRVSELVSLDIDDIDTRKHCFTVIRKRGKEDVVYMSDRVENLILDWLEVRKGYHIPDDERALFTSSSGIHIGTRMTVRGVQLLVKKYAKLGAPEIGFKITPHKLRSTCATTAIEACGDINYVKTLLGHESITTTTRYIKDNEKLKENRRNML